MQLSRGANDDVRWVIALTYEALGMHDRTLSNRFDVDLLRFRECASGFLDSPETVRFGVWKRFVCRQLILRSGLHPTGPE